MKIKIKKHDSKTNASRHLAWFPIKLDIWENGNCNQYWLLWEFYWKVGKDKDFDTPIYCFHCEKYDRYAIERNFIDLFQFLIYVAFISLIFI